MHAAALVQVDAALDRQLTSGGDGVPFRSRTQLATRVAPELIGYRLHWGTGVSFGVRRSVGRLPVRPSNATRLGDTLPSLGMGMDRD